jgi:hypothetical protein
MLQYLTKAALAADKTCRVQVETQMSLAWRAIRMLYKIYADVSALRVGYGDDFEGTGACEWGHEEVQIKLHWPNLAILTDETKQILDELAMTDRTDLQINVGNRVRFIADDKSVGSLKESWLT